MMVKKQPDIGDTVPSAGATIVGREAPAYLLRLPVELRDRLRKEARLNGRSMNTELVGRLQRSIEQQGGAPIRYAAREPEVAPYLAQSDAEREILALFRRWPAEKQLALLSLFK